MKSLIFEWHLSDEEIAAFLNGANPNWSRAVLVDMDADFSTMTSEVVARLNRDWELLAFEAVYEYIVKISAALSGSRIERFPRDFASRSTTTH